MIKDDLGLIGLTPEQIELLNKLTTSLNNNQKIWLSGYLARVDKSISAISQILGNKNTTVSIQNNSHTEAKPGFTILFGSHTGNGEQLANRVAELAKNQGINADVKNMLEYKPRNIADEKNLLIIVSTHGEGDPPFSAEELHAYLHGKRAPKLTNLNYTVLALGDSSYLHFCKTGKDFDLKLQELGAKRLLDRVDCDLDFEDKANAWIEESLNKFKSYIGASSTISVKGTPQIKEASSEYSKKNPYQAAVLEKVALNGKGSAKETLHVELSLENSGLVYEPGDAIGVYGVNSDKIVKEIIKKTGFNSNELIQNGEGKEQLNKALRNKYELTVINREVVNKYAKLALNDKLDAILADNEKLKKYLYGKDIVDLLTDFPAKLDPVQFLEILRKLPPRLYSISSSLKAHPDEAHVTVGVVRYSHNKRSKEGVCSTFLSDRIDEDEFVPVYIDKNTNFKLPKDSSAPVIMVGPGTGVAPFRAFVEERELSDVKGKNWLFFGDQHFNTDFLYQLEWQSFLKSGALTRLDVAFSRDTDKKVYVQHKMLEKSKELFRWLEEGAHFYVCGDMHNMASDVHKSLHTIVEEEGGMSKDKAMEYVREMQKTRRYQIDVY